MTASEIYAKYRIMPNLQLHQLRAASVAKIVFDAYQGELDQRDILAATLFHDMGNIIKFQLDVFPEFSEPEGVDHWLRVQREFVNTYGNAEHQATLAIAREIGLPARVVELIDGVGFGKLDRTRDSASYEQKIVEYADLRVGPHGVLSMGERLEEARRRYAKKSSDIPANRETYEKLKEAAEEIERQIFSSCSIKPEDITDSSVTPILEEFKQFQVE